MRIGSLSRDGRYQILVNDGYYVVVIAFVEIFSKICVVKNRRDSVRLS